MREVRLIQAAKSIVPAFDIPFDDVRDLSNALVGEMGFGTIPGIGGIKTGITLETNLASAVAIIRQTLGSKIQIIHDHQKAGCDIPDMGKPFADTLVRAEVNAAILFPLAGPATEEAWIKACFEVGLDVLVGGVMTHPKFLVSEGGWIDDAAVEKIYRLACQLGATNFIVPGTKLDWVKRIYGWLVQELGEGNFDLLAPGFISQGGDISECAKAAGPRWHAIIGGAIYKEPTMELKRQAAIRLTQQILAA